MEIRLIFWKLGVRLGQWIGLRSGEALKRFHCVYVHWMSSFERAHTHTHTHPTQTNHSLCIRQIGFSLFECHEMPVCGKRRCLISFCQACKQIRHENEQHATRARKSRKVTAHRCAMQQKSMSHFWLLSLFGIFLWIRENWNAVIRSHIRSTHSVQRHEYVLCTCMHNFCAPYLHTFTAFLIHFLFYFAFFNRKRFYINQFNLRTYELKWSWNSICPYWNEALILGNATTNDCLLFHLFDCIIAGDFYSFACILHFTHCQDKNQVFHRFWAVFFKSGNE